MRDNLMTPAETLQAVRDLLADESNWCKGSLAKTAPDENSIEGDRDSINPLSRHARQWSIEGAIEKVTGGIPEYRTALNTPGLFTGVDLVAFNDGASHAEVLAFLDEKIALLKI